MKDNWKQPIPHSGSIVILGMLAVTLILAVVAG